MAREGTCEATKTLPATWRCCRSPNPMQPQLRLSCGETCVGISPLSFGQGPRVLFCKTEKQGLEQHAPVVELPRIYAELIASRNSAYKERARLHHALLDNAAIKDANLPPISHARPFRSSAEMRSLTVNHARRTPQTRAEPLKSSPHRSICESTCQTVRRPRNDVDGCSRAPYPRR